MKIFNLLSCMLLVTRLLGQVSTNNSCLEPQTLGQFQNKAIGLFDSISAKHAHINIKSQLSDVKKLSLYKKAFSFFNKDSIKCETIAQWSMVELYLEHDYFKHLYIVIETIDARFFAVSFDMVMQEGKYLGEIKNDYFSMMVRSILNNTENDFGENYILFAILSNKSIREIELTTNVNLWTINQITLLESILLEK